MKKYTRSSDFRLGRGQNVLASAEALNLKMPRAVEDARKRLVALTARQRALITDTEARAATVALLLADPEADITAAASAEITRDVLANSLTQAIDTVRSEITSIAMQHGDELLADCRSRVFEPAVNVLVKVAAIEPGASLAGLVQAKRTDEAEAFTQAAAAAEQVRAAFRFRSTIYRNEDGGMPHARWENPQDIDWTGAENLTGLPWFLFGIRAGGRPALFDLAELDARSRTWQAEENARQAADAESTRTKVLAARAVRDDRARQLEERKKKSARRRSRAA